MPGLFGSTSCAFSYSPMASSNRPTRESRTPRFDRTAASFGRIERKSLYASIACSRSPRSCMPKACCSKASGDDAWAFSKPARRKPVASSRYIEKTIVILDDSGTFQHEEEPQNFGFDAPAIAQYSSRMTLIDFRAIGTRTKHYAPLRAGCDKGFWWTW